MQFPWRNRTSRSDEDEQSFVESLNVRNRYALRFLIIFAGVAYPIFGVLDYIVVPEQIGLFMMLRAVCAGVALLVFLVSTRKWSLSYVRHLGIIVGWTAGFLIGVMVHFDGGYASPYYAGMNLVILPSCLLFIWSMSWNLIMGVPIYLAYLLPCLLFNTIENVPLFLAHNAFILFTVIFITIVQHFNLQRQRDIFFSNLDLERAKADLETAHQDLEEAHEGLEEAHEGLEEAHDKLQKLDRVKNQFFANITHELRTPLTMILTPVDAIMEGDLGDFEGHQLNYFRSIRENSVRLLKLINDLLELTRLQDSQVRLRVEEVDVSIFLDQIVEIVEGMAERKRISLIKESDGGHLWIDPIQMERVLLNLIANALKFTPTGGRISIRAESHDDMMVLSVIDSGIGIPKEHLTNVFDRFFQSDASSTRQYGGAGIGLSLVKELVDLHNGEIHIDSEIDVGTTITITLHCGREHFRSEVLDRRRRGDGKQRRRLDDAGISEWTHQIVDQESFRYLDINRVTERRIVPRGNERFKEARVLIIEDTPEMLRLLNTLLGETYEVFTAMDGVTGLDLAREKKPDLVLSDGMLPGIDGFTLCKELKSNSSTMHIPIVLLTARSSLEERIEGLEQGADAYLTKPFSPRELHAVVRELLKNRANAAKLVLRKRLDGLQIISARMAHEIFNPLNMIKNSVEAIKMILDRSTDEAIQKSLKPFLDIADRATPRIQETVELMKLYSQEGFAPTLRSYDVNEAIQQVLKLVAMPSDKQCNIQVIEECQGRFICQPAEFNQALTNVIENAIESLEEDGDVIIRVFEDEVHVGIEVSDTGCGIAPDELDRIFSPFYTTKGPNEGMGLGTTITLQTLEVLGGDIDVRSKLGEGTSITLYVPKTIHTSSAEHALEA